MKRTINILILFFILITINQTAIAVSAYPYLVEITQPDGSKITIILKGDEHVKWAQTTDGYSIMRNSSGFFEYAILDSKSDMIPSGIRAADQSKRNNSDIQFLSKIKKGLTYSKSQVGIMKSISKMYQKSSPSTFPTTGNRKLVCILIGFTDLHISKTQSDFNNLFNQVGYSIDNATGSVFDYYKENSFSQLNLTVTVAGPYVAKHDMAFYGANDSNGNDVRPDSLVAEAVRLADPAVNYANFDNDNNGTVDGVYVIYAGYGEEAGAPSTAIWAHASQIPTYTSPDGVTISSYSCSPELRGNSGTGITRIGVICHEFGHVMGAADYYDTDYTGTGDEYLGTGDWDIMASGSWDNNGATPAHHNPYTKIFNYGWAAATTISSAKSVTLNNAEQNTNSFYRINTTTANEFFLIENRQQQLFDGYIPGHGMLIYHVDGNFISAHFNSNDINAGAHQGMYPVCASAILNPGTSPFSYGSINAGGCSFPGTSLKTSFTDFTTPNSLSWVGALTHVPISGIIENVGAKTVSFTTTITTDVETSNELKAFMLGQNYPNPFDNSTTIEFRIVKAGKVSLEVFNTLGQLVDVIVDESLPAGNYTKQWSPKGISNGIYFYQLRAEGIKETKKLVKK